MSGFVAVEFLLACIGAQTAGRWVHRRLMRTSRPADEESR